MPIIVQVLIIRIVRGVSGGDIFAYLVVLSYLAIHTFIVVVILKKRKELIKVCFTGLMIGALICIFLFYNHNVQPEKTRKPHVEIGY